MSETNPDRIVSDMVIHLYSGVYSEMPVDLKELVRGTAVPDAANINLYTCKHFDGESCTNYDNRPNMCRKYPYYNRCNYAGCTWKAARDGRTRDGVVVEPLPTVSPLTNSASAVTAYDNAEKVAPC